MSMYLGNELVTGTKIRKIQVQNLATGESDYYYFGEPCDEGDIVNYPRPKGRWVSAAKCFYECDLSDQSGIFDDTGKCSKI